MIDDYHIDGNAIILLEHNPEDDSSKEAQRIELSDQLLASMYGYKLQTVFEAGDDQITFWFQNGIKVPDPDFDELRILTAKSYLR
jgi:hypothetical protein